MNKELLLFYKDLIEYRGRLRDFPALPRNIINEYFIKKGYTKYKISKYLKELRKEQLIGFVYIDEEYSPIGRWGWETYKKI